MKNDWQTVLLGEILAARQETPSPIDLESGRVRVIAKIGFNDGVIQLRNGGETKTGMILIRPNDLVISGINAAKGAIAIYDPNATEPIAATIHYSSYSHNKDRVDLHFLWYLLRSEAFRTSLNQNLAGGIKSELKPKLFLSVPVAIPSLTEQQRIVARIEELARRVEEARGLRRAAAEETETLVARVTSQKLDNAGWEIRSLESVLAEPPRNGLSPQSKIDGEGRKMLRINAVSSSPSRFLDLSAFKFVDVADKVARPFEIQNDDIFMVRYNGDLNRVAKAAIFKSDFKSDVIYPDKLIRLRADKSKITPDYLAISLGARSVRNQIEEMGKTTAGQIGVSGSDAKSFQIPLPPLAEQHRIVAHLDHLQQKVDELRRLQAATQTELDALLPSILAKAFAGEL